MVREGAAGAEAPSALQREYARLLAWRVSVFVQLR
jgi:hypothetical protein